MVVVVTSTPRPFSCASASAVFGRLCSASVVLSSYFWSLWSREDDEEAIFEETTPAISSSEVGIERAGRVVTELVSGCESQMLIG